MSPFRRFLVILICIVASSVIVQFSKAPTSVPYRGYRVACMPLNSAKKEAADKNLIPYAQIAHTSFSPEDPALQYRCYFRFAPQDVVCTPPSIATRRNVQSCAQFPTIDGNSKKQCYVLNNKLIPLTENLKKQPPVNIQSYLTDSTAIVKSWQEVRDMLLRPSGNS